MTYLWNALLSLLPAIDWKEVVHKQGLPTAVIACALWFFGYELLIPLRDEFVQFVREVRAANRDLAKAKLDDSVTLSKLARLLELREDAESIAHK